ncbi:MAG TPA: hypothetical protein DER05_05040 [Lutibacter sp.]|nr:hypothetical protein [Lutibacter sp.]
MKLNFKEEIEAIDGCPGTNESGTKKLYRFVKLPLDGKSFIPHSVKHKPRFKNNCIAWGLSTYDTLKSARQAYKNLPETRRAEFDGIAFGDVKDIDGTKYQSTKNLRHYTFFPLEKLSCVALFANIESYEN